MTEARIKVINNDFIEFDARVAEGFEHHEYTLKMFEPPVTVRHGKDHLDGIVLTQGKHTRTIEPGEYAQYRLDKKTIEIAHKGDIVKFK